MGEWQLLPIALLPDGTQFKKQDKPSFRSVDDLMSWMDSLPQGPQWCCTKIELDKYVTVHPVYLLWRDASDVTRMIFSNPIFHQHMSLDPHEVYTGHDEREYGEWMSSKEAFRIQVSRHPCFLHTLSNKTVAIPNSDAVREAHCNHLLEFRLYLVRTNNVHPLGYKSLPGVM